MDGLPSSTLKAQFLDQLESDESSLKGLGNVLRIDITRYATVRELVGNYEERFGELSLNKWRFILKRLGHLEFFQQHVVADQFIADLTDIEDLDDKPSVATVQWPRHDHVGRYVSTPAGSLPDGKQLQVKHQSECKSKKIQPKKDKELNMSAMSKGTGGKIAKSHQNSRKWPDWSLPPPEESEEKETAVDDMAKGDIDHNSTLEAATESGFFSDEGTNKMPSNSEALSHDGENGTGQCENAVITATPTSSLQADSKLQQSHEAPSRPSSPEAPHSPHVSLVTDQQKSRQTNAALGGTYPSEIAAVAETPASSLQADSKQQSHETPSRPSSPEAPHSSHDSLVTGQQKSRQTNAALGGTYPSENAAVAETPASSLQADSKQQSHETPSRPSSPEAPHSSHDSLVTGQQKSRQTNAALGGTYPSENAAVAETPASSLQADSKQQSHETPSRPSSPEAPHSSHDSLVTGQQKSRQTNAAVGGMYPSENGEQDLTRETGNPAEQYDDSDNNGLLAELQKLLKSSQLNVSFLVQELRKKDSYCASLRTNYHLLYQELEVSRGECAQLQERVEELRRYLDQSTVLEDESQQLIRMILEMYRFKEQQCNRLEEELRSVVGAMQELLRHHEEHLRRERERIRLDSERRLEERLVEVRRAFDNAETEKVKRLEQALEQEKSNRKEIEEKSKTLLQETRRLRMLPRQMKSKEEGFVTSGCSYEDDVSSHTASGDVEGDEHPGLSSHNQQSDSEDSSEDEHFEDARDDFYFP